MLITPRGQFSVGKLSTEDEVVKSIKGNLGYTSRSFTRLGITFTNVVKTTSDFRGMDPKKRNCYFPDEVSLDFFPEYSETSCILECTWRSASEACQCVPWYLGQQLPDKDLCEIYGNRCFEEIVGKRNSLSDGLCVEKCLPDCEPVEFKLDKGYSRVSDFCKEDMSEVTEAEKRFICKYFDEKYTIDDPVMKEIAGSYDTLDR